MDFPFSEILHHLKAIGIIVLASKDVVALSSSAISYSASPKAELVAASIHIKEAHPIFISTALYLV